MAKKILLIIPIAIVIFNGGCKPSERNYREAYDAAQKKKETAKKEISSLSVPATGFHEYGEKPKQTVNGVELGISSEFLSLVKGPEKSIQKWNVAVASYKMKTNAISQMNSLVKEGFDSFVAENPENRYFVFAGAFATKDEAASFASKYAEKKDSSSFIGLDGAPILIEKRW